MGFFTLELARLVGASGRVVAVDPQPRMIAGLRRRARRAELLDRIDARVFPPTSDCILTVPQGLDQNNAASVPLVSEIVARGPNDAYRFL
jgi:hypothetical protein